ncbi:MAG: YcgL domain-containing protein [Gammaproteobacteria bacterium]|nr:YcgL domain-containing protein [Gammaproteobacteria bacterium]
MHCAIYKGNRKQDTYLYVEREDDFTRVPEPLLAMLGPLEFVLALELTPKRKLARANTDEVLEQLSERGYYLQLPPQEQTI